jgi:CBS domain-containing protein
VPVVAVFDKVLGKLRSGSAPLRRAQVSDVMQTNVEFCLPSATLAEVAKIMWDRDCGSVPVVTDDHKVVAMLTDRDICMAAYMTNRPLTEICARDAMSRELFSCRPYDRVPNVEHLMQDRQVRRLPVVNPEGRLVGIVSLADLARASRVRRGSVSPAALAETLGAISERRASGA